MIFKSEIFKNILKFKLIHTIVLFLFIYFITTTQWFMALNNYIYDLFLFVNPYKQQQKEIVVVGIDDKSINHIGSWPWKREVYAKFLDKIFEDGPQIVAFYLAFHNYYDKQTDQLFINTLKRYPTIIIHAHLTSKFSTDNPFWVELSKTSILGHNIFSVDKDQVVRKQFLFANQTPSFAMAILKYCKPDIYRFYESKCNSQQQTLIIPINYKRPIDKFEKVSFTDVLDGKIEKGFFKDKIVIVGTNSKSIAEERVTPFTRNQKGGSTGAANVVYIQAQILDSLMNFPELKYLDAAKELVVVGILLFLVLNFFYRLGIVRQIVLTFIVLPSLFCLVSLISLIEFNLWVSPLPFLLTILMSFLVVLINNIAATSRVLDKYINELSSKANAKGLVTESSIDSKLESLKGLTDHITADKNLLETVLISVSSIIMLFDHEGAIIYTNSPNYNEGFNINNLSEEINLNEIKEITRNDKYYKRRISLKGGYFNFIITPAKGDCFVGILNDVTDMVRMSEMKSDMLRMLSHEFKTPLATILLCSDCLEQLSDQDTNRKYIQRIISQTEFLEEMIDSFLSLNKLEVSDYEIHREKVDFKLFITGIIDNLSEIALNKSITITHNYNTEIKDLAIDHKYMFIAIKNLIDNAIKYSPEKTIIIVTITDQEGYILVSIKDQGYGMSKEAVTKLFNKFYRVKTQQTKQVKGTGLGLSFVKRIVELHGGEITLNSKENEGSEFVFKIPFNESPINS